jgi:hypothetical protein
VPETIASQPPHAQPASAALEQPGQSVIGLLDPHREVVDFVGRTDEIAELLGWCADGQDSPLRIVVGPSGAGKTRLAVELAREMRARGWRIEWVSSGRKAAAGPATAAPAAAPSIVHRKSLLIIDDADERTDLTELIGALRHNQPRARILLLARSAGSWFDQLELSGPAYYTLVSAARATLTELAAAATAELTDTEVTAAAAASFAAELGLPAPAGLTIHRADRSGMLDLHITALMAVLGQPGPPGPAAPSVSLVEPESAIDTLLAYESQFWSSGDQNSAELTPRQNVAATYLLGQAKALPQRVADVLVARELAGSSELAKRLLTGVDADQALAAAALLARVSSDRPQPPDSLDEAIALIAAELESLDAPAQTLIAILNVLPYPSSVWNAAGAAICGRIADAHGPDTDPAMRAYWLNSLGARLWQVRRRSEAVGHTRQAVAIRRKLASADPDRHLPGLALSLSNLGRQLAGIDRTSDAIGTTAEAAAIYRAIAVIEPSRYLPRLVTTLTRLGTYCARAGKSADAAEASEEAARIGRQMAEASPGHSAGDHGDHGDHGSSAGASA